MDDSKSEKIYKFVSHKAASLKSGNPHQAKAVLANLRRAAGKSLAQSPDLWGALMDEFPEELVGRGNNPSAGEAAVFDALTLLAIAQQGHDPAADSMNKSGVSLGEAAGLLARLSGRAGEEENDRVLTRLKRIVSSESTKQMQVPLRSLIQLISDRGIGLDYARLGTDLYKWNYPEGREAVRLKWARDYFKSLHKSKDAGEKTPQDA